MTEIEINNGQNIIDIYFDDFASCLIVKKALAANWPDNHGSVGEYYSISNYSNDERNSYTKTINNALSEGNDLEQIEVIKDFLNLFANGKYSINKFTAKIDKIELLTSNQVTYGEDVPQNEKFSGWFLSNWESYYELVYSITNDKIDPNRVEFYCELIKNGFRPTIVTFEVCNTLSAKYSRPYVLDGHHKIEAYLKLKENIPIISILKSEECINKTGPLLRFAKSFLQDCELKHIFVNNDENLQTIDFINDIELTSELDDILKNSSKIDVSIIRVLRKYSKSKNQLEIQWIELRINTLKENKNVDLLGYGNGLSAYEIKMDEKRGECWFGINLKTKSQLDNWINETINNCA